MSPPRKQSGVRAQRPLAGTPSPWPHQAASGGSLLYLETSRAQLGSHSGSHTDERLLDPPDFHEQQRDAIPGHGLI